MRILRRIVLVVILGVILAVALVVGQVSESAVQQPFLYTLTGALIQVTDYTYTVTLHPTDNILQVTVPLIRQTVQPWYQVTIATQEVSANKLWQESHEETDRLGNRWMSLSWRNPPATVILKRYVQATTTALYGPIISSDTYPLPSGALPAAVYEWLLPSGTIQSTDSKIRAMADSVVQGARTELEAVVRILSWVRDHVQYACGRDLCQPVYRIDALATLEKGIGNCVCYANLALALLRAAGIPSMYVTGFVADRADSRAGHAWIAAYFPQWGWVEFESADWIPASHLVPLTFLMPEHLTAYFGTGRGISRAEFSELHRSSYKVAAQPKPVQSLSVSVPKGKAVSLFITVACPDQRARTIDLALAGVPSGWYAALSRKVVRIDPDNDPWYTRDVFLTVIPGDDASGQDMAEISLSAQSAGKALGQITMLVKRTD